MRKSVFRKALFSLTLLLFVLWNINHGLSLAREQSAQASGTKEKSKLAQTTFTYTISPQRLYNRAWYLIHDEYYEQDYHGQDWNYWKDRYAGKLKTLDDAHKAIETMLAGLGDKYTRFLDPEAFEDEKDQIAAHLYGIGIQIGMDKSQRIIVIAPLDDTPAAKAGVAAGDEIAEINGTSTKGLSVEEAAKNIKGPKDTPVELTLISKGNKRKLKIVRDEIHISSVSTAKMITQEIGYIRLTSFISHKANEEMQKALANLSGAKGLILDLRDNPGGLLTNAIDISNMFLGGRYNIVSTVDKDGYKTPALADGHPISKQALVVLINRGSASASEIASGALKDNGRAILVGQRTYGKGLVQGITRLEDGSGINYTIAKYLTPSDTDINNKGIDPDIVVDLDDQDFKDAKGPWWLDPEGPAIARQPEDLKDIQLKRAVDALKEKIDSKVVVGKAPNISSIAGP
ncbi:MAG: S41 family peptidase [Candidatus Obscuribacterales bacterium]|nr:S41 family peptidase [Candidatus Obscuribacterales bacterium]